MPPVETAQTSGPVDQNPTDETDEDGALSCEALSAFLQLYPDARLVDVRDVVEHEAGRHLLPSSLSAATATLNMPLDTLRHTMPAEMSQALGPLVMFCRSGARSRQAAALLRERGHTQVWHLEGGLALAEMA